MPEVYRRVILKPANLSSSAAAELANGLTAAIDAQRRFESSAHVLRFIGDLKEDDDSFFVEHERATAKVSPGTWFDRQAALSEPRELLQVAAALFDALRVAHASEPPQLRVHGALCPGVLLSTPDGIDKVTDFGFAPAICGALGADSFLNLAVGPPDQGSGTARGTGIWQILSLDEYKREDRICAFIDPDKYGTAILGAFEPGSDIIAAGFLLHLMAEHQHPYFARFPEAHRDVEMSQEMKGFRYPGNRRPDLRENADEGVRLWCTLVAKTLERLPRNRPTAAEVAGALGAHVKPVDAASILEGQFRTLIEHAHEVDPDQANWASIRDKARTFADHGAATDELRVEADALHKEAHARLLIRQAADLLQTDNWPDAQQPLDEILSLRGLPDDLVRRATAENTILHQHLETARNLDEVEARFKDVAGLEPAAVQGVAQALLARIEELPPPEGSPSSIQSRRDSLQTRIQAKLSEAAAEVERIEVERRAACKAAEAWLTDLGNALEAQKWDTVRETLRERPSFEHGPEDAEARVAQFEKLLEAHEAEQRQRAAREADETTARDWIQEVRGAVELKRWDVADQLLCRKPPIQEENWPDNVLEEEREHAHAVAAYRLGQAREAVDAGRLDEAEQILRNPPKSRPVGDKILASEEQKLTRAIKDARQRQADQERAAQWIQELGGAVESELWDDVPGILARRPVLEHWPPKTLARERACRDKIAENIETRQLKERQAQESLGGARKLVEEGAFDKALDRLDSPPLDAPPRKIRKKVAELRKFCEKALEQLRQERTQQVVGCAAAFVRAIVATRLKRLLDPDLVQTTTQDVEFTEPRAPDHGRARIAIGLRPDAAPSKMEELRRPCEFAFAGGSPRICDDDRRLEEQVFASLTKGLIKLQHARLHDLFIPLRSGVFPEAETEPAPRELTERQALKVALCGPGVTNATVDTNIEWDRTALIWKHLDARGFTARALEIVTRQAELALGPKMEEALPDLTPYTSRASWKVAAAPLPDPNALSKAVSLEVALTIRPGAEGEPVVLQTFPITCPQVGQVSIDAPLAAARDDLRRLILAAQSSARSALERDFQQRMREAAVEAAVAVFPKRVRRIQDTVRFELRPRRGKRLTIATRWNAEAFDFELPDDWENQFDQFLRETAGVVARSAWPTLAVLSGAAAILVVSILFIHGITSPREGDTFVRDNGGVDPAPVAEDVITDRSEPDEVVESDDVIDGGQQSNAPSTSESVTETPPATTTEVREDEVSPGEEHLPREVAGPTDVSASTSDPYVAQSEGPSEDPDKATTPVPVPSVDPALAGARDILAGSAFLTEGQVRDLNLVQALGDTSTTQAQLSITVPGLAESPLVVDLTKRDGDHAWALSEREETAIRDAGEGLDRLLNMVEPRSLDTVLPQGMDVPELVRFVDLSRLKIRAATTPPWQLEGDRWLANGSSCEVSITTPGDGIAMPPVVDASVTLEARNGDVSVSDEASVAELVRSIGQAILARQNESVRHLEEQLTAALARTGSSDDPPHVEIPESEGLRDAVEMAAEWSGMQPRKYSATWNRGELIFRFDDGSGSDWEDRARADRFAHDVLREIDQAMDTNHWLRRGSRGPVLESRAAGGDGNWILAVGAPWVDRIGPDSSGPTDRLPIVVERSWLQELDESPRHIADRIVQRGLQRPPYWQLIEEYVGANRESRGLLLSEWPVEVLEDIANIDRLPRDVYNDFLTSVILLWKDAQFVGPELRLTADQVTVEASDSGPTKLGMELEGGWGIIPRAPSLPQAVDAEGLEALTESLRTLFEAGPCKLTMTVPSGRLVRSWSETEELVGAFGGTWRRAAALDERLAQLDARQEVEKRLEDVLRGESPGANSATLPEPVAFQVLNHIWTVKGGPGPQTATFPEFSSNLQLRLGRQRETFRKSAEITPTVFGEYFCGPQFTYALVWSAEPRREVVVDAPTLLRLCSTSRLYQDDADAAGDGLGETLLGPVFSATAEACEASRLSNFEKQLGVVLAPDDLMGLLDLDALRLATSRNTLLASTEPARNIPASRLEWQALEDLETGLLEERMCGYLLCKTLPGSVGREGEWEPVAEDDRTAWRWAAAVINDALAWNRAR